MAFLFYCLDIEFVVAIWSNRNFSGEAYLFKGIVNIVHGLTSSSENLKRPCDYLYTIGIAFLIYLPRLAFALAFWSKDAIGPFQNCLVESLPAQEITIVHSLSSLSENL